MEVKLGKQNIEEQYAQGPGTTPDVSQAQVPQQQPMTMEEEDAFLDENLPRLRKQAEYNRLMMERFENDALLNRRPISSIPGLLGLELKVREMQALGYLSQIQAGMNTAEQELKKEEEKEAKATK